MTEDDTFRILRRATVSEMTEIIKKEFTPELSTEERIKVFWKHGWSYVDFYTNHPTVL